MTSPFLYQHLLEARRPRRSSSNWLLLRRRLPPGMRTTWTRSCHLVNTQRTDNCGSAMSHQLLLQESTLSTFKMNWTRGCKQDRLERQASAPSVRSSMHSASTSWFVRLLFNALREGSSWWELETRSRWQSRLTRHSTKALSHTAWGKPSWQSNARMTCRTQSDS